MADEALYTAKGTNNPIIHAAQNISDFMVIRTLDGTAYVGDIVVQATAFPDIDQCADNEAGLHMGIIIGPVVRPSDTWTADTILADNTEVWVLRFGSGSKVWMLINGQDTPIAGVDGDDVYSTSTDGSTNDSHDGAGSLNNTQGFAARVGKLAGAATTGNSTSAINGTYMAVYV